jgi:tRNA nucleotidyltransferase (CCA-adding enzyme)
MAVEIDPAELPERIAALPGTGRLREAAADSAHLVGGAVRDLLMGRDRVDVDVVVEGDAIALARELDPAAVVHERFGTATVMLDGLSVDLATARSETYQRPGALPEVTPGALADDLARRDFTVNAMAASVAGGALTDPHGGLADLRQGVLRVLHDGSFADDATRALRAARYGARLDLELEPRTAELLQAADLGTVSRQRVEGELRRIAAEDDPAAALALAREWGLLDLSEDDLALLRHALVAAGEEPLRDLATAAELTLAVATGELEAARELARLRPESPADAVEAAHGRRGADLVLAYAAGAAWIGDYAADWRDVRLAITGTDLISAGVEEGPAVGRGLRAALRARLNGEAADREDQMRVALEAAR